MNISRGFAPLILILFIAGLIAVGGAGWMITKQQDKKTVSAEEIQTTVSTPTTPVQEAETNSNLPASNDRLELTPVHGENPLTVTATFPAAWRDTVQEWCANSDRSWNVGDKSVSIDWGDRRVEEGCSSHVYEKAGTYVVVARVNVLSKMESPHCGGGGGNGGVGCLPPYPVYTLLWQATSTPVVVEISPKTMATWKAFNNETYGISFKYPQDYDAPKVFPSTSTPEILIQRSGGSTIEIVMEPAIKNKCFGGISKDLCEISATKNSEVNGKRWDIIGEESPFGGEAKTTYRMVQGTCRYYVQFGREDRQGEFLSTLQLSKTICQ